MARMRLAFSAVSALSLGSVAVYAQMDQQCPSSDLCYSLNIPSDTASSGSSGDIYFQIWAPTSMSWAALGQGTHMAGANMFVVYTSSDGNNVTVSPRLGTGHVQPQHDTDAQITLLEGSGVSNGVMTANVRCSNCASWNGGSMDFKSSSGSWIWAAKSGSALNSDDLNENIREHNGNGRFDFDFSRAQGGSSLNPFYTSAAASGSPAVTTGTGAAATPAYGGYGPGSGSGSGSDGDNPYSNGGSNSAFGQNNLPFGGDFGKADRIRTAHAALACLAFLAFFPTGAILVRLGSFKGLVWVHAAIQASGFLLFVAAFGLGVYMATQFNYYNHAHPIIGTIGFAVLFTQPVTGLAHHILFKRKHIRTFPSYTHIGLGRIAIILGMINGGLGLQLAGNASTGEIVAYSVLAGIIGVVYLAVIVFGEIKRSRNNRQQDVASTSKNGRGTGSDSEIPMADTDAAAANREFYGKREPRTEDRA